MIKINEDWSFPQPSIKCNYCMQHRVKLLWCICWDIIYATYLQRGIDLLLWMFYKRVSRDKHGEICGYWGWSIIWLIMTNLLNLTSHCIFIVIWSQNLRVSFSFIIIFFSGRVIPMFWHASLVTCFTYNVGVKFELTGDRHKIWNQRILVWMGFSHIIFMWPWVWTFWFCHLSVFKMEHVIQLRSHWFSR